MSAPIDLDLVELRAKLRGWRVERNWGPDYGGPRLCVSEVHTPHGVLWVQDDGQWGGDCDSTQGYEREITRRRLTLADIVAHPPEGWAVKARSGPRPRFVWCADGTREVDAPAAVHWLPGEAPVTHVCPLIPIERQAAAHRAIADLLALLGEVAP